VAEARRRAQGAFGGGDLGLSPREGGVLGKGRPHHLVRGQARREGGAQREPQGASSASPTTPNRRNSTGTTNMLRTVLDSRPPSITTPIGAWISLPASIGGEHQRDQREPRGERGHQHGTSRSIEPRTHGLLEVRPSSRTRCS
jgi:hypothetical protein